MNSSRHSLFLSSSPSLGSFSLDNISDTRLYIIDTSYFIQFGGVGGQSCRSTFLFSFSFFPSRLFLGDGGDWYKYTRNDDRYARYKLKTIIHILIEPPLGAFGGSALSVASSDDGRRRLRSASKRSFRYRFIKQQSSQLRFRQKRRCSFPKRVDIEKVTGEKIFAKQVLVGKL